MGRIRVSTTIDASPAVVWDEVRHIERHVDWMADAVAIEFTSRRRSGVGTTFDCRTKVGPIRLTDRMEITEWRDGKLYLRFCAETEERGGYPVCPAFGDVDAYVVPDGKRLAWYRLDGPASENQFKHYVTLDRVPKGGKAPLDTQCKDD